MRTMYDSITARDIPANAQIVAGYVNGTWKWSDADWARFPHAVQVRIATQAYVNDGNVLDVERGDATPAEAPGWVRMRRAAGVDPTVYCGVSALASVQAAFASAGVAQPHYWIAHYDNVPSIPSGCVAKQYINPPTSGGHYDLSVVADYWPGIDSASNGGGGSPAAFQGEDEDMQIIDCPAIPEKGLIEAYTGGSDQARITIYPGATGVWVEHVYWWGEGHVPNDNQTGGMGVQSDPATSNGGQPKYYDAITTFACPKALLSQLLYSSDSAFRVVARG